MILEKEEEIKSAVAKWSREHEIYGAAVFGIGAVKNVELAAYEPENNRWAKKNFKGFYELVSLAGNINADGLHAHVVISDLKFNTFAGHLECATVSTFAELFVIPTNRLKKVPLGNTALKKIQLQP
ncbi:MAG: DNA-binding protein [Candidatus Micrarchaeota archaeon]|nr:DNA-binding protein [Candidatus Micrarchaeota archaeon]